MQHITSSVISNEKYDIHRGYKFLSIQLFLRYKKRVLHFKNRYAKFYKFYHKIYPENLRTDLLDFYEPERNNKLDNFPWYIESRTVSLRKISWYRYWLRFTKMLNVFRYWTNIGKFFKRNIYFKSSISRKLRNFKIVQYYTVKHYKFKNLLLLEDIYLKLMKFGGIYALSGLSFTSDAYMSYNYYQLIKLYFNNKFYLSQLKLKMLNNHLTSLLNFNINVISEKSSFRLRRLYFYSNESKYEFNLKSYLLIIKNILYTFSKFEESKFFYNFNYKSTIPYSHNDFLSNSFSLPKFNYLKISNETKFIKFVLSKNMDFSLFNILSYKKSLTRRDFVIAFKYIIYNNLVKFFKSTKLEKNFILVQYILKFYFLWATKMLLLKKTYFIKNFKSKTIFFKKKIQKFSLIQLVSLSFSVNYFINYNIQIWRNYQRLSRKVNTFFKNWLKKKKFLFWLTHEFEKDLRQKIDIFFINSITAISTLDRFNTKNFFKVINWILAPW
jgi:hypothetical protein